MVKVFFILVFLGMLLCGCERQEEEKIKIGVLSPLSGPGTIWGFDNKRGIELAYEDLNATEFELIYLDTKCRKDISIEKTEELLERGVDYIIGEICSNATIVVGKIMEKNKKILISSCSSSPEISELGDYVFRTWISDEIKGKNVSEDFFRKFVIKYGVAPDVCAAPAYDSLALLITSIRSAGNNPQKVKDYLYNVKKYKGAQGIISINEKGDAIKE